MEISFFAYDHSRIYAKLHRRIINRCIGDVVDGRMNIFDGFVDELWHHEVQQPFCCCGGLIFTRNIAAIGFVA